MEIRHGQDSDFEIFAAEFSVYRLLQLSLLEDRFDTGEKIRPAGPVRSHLFGPVPVPIFKNTDQFHL
jgi:hypothetical protein